MKEEERKRKTKTDYISDYIFDPRFSIPKPRRKKREERRGAKEGK